MEASNEDLTMHNLHSFHLEILRRLRSAYLALSIGSLRTLKVISRVRSVILSQLRISVLY